MPEPLHTAGEAAAILRLKSPRWLKEQARLRRIPFTMLGGSYRFSDAHLDEIIAMFEERPEPARGGVRGPGRRSAPAPIPAAEPVLRVLTPRGPRRKAAAA